MYLANYFNWLRVLVSPRPLVFVPKTINNNNNNNFDCWAEGSTNSQNGPDQIHTLFYGMDWTMNADFKRMWQVRCHIGILV